MQSEDIQHNDANSKRALRLHAVRSDQFIIHNIAILSDVPRSAFVDALRIDGVRRRLDVDAICPQD